MNFVTSVCERFSPALRPMNAASSSVSGRCTRKALFARRASQTLSSSGLMSFGSLRFFFLPSRASRLAALMASWTPFTASRRRVWSSPLSALSFSPRAASWTSELSVDSTTAGADGVSTVGTVSDGAAAAFSTFTALAFGALASFGALGAAAATGAGAATTGAAGLASDFLAGILFALTTEEEADISNALLYSYPMAVM